MTTRLRWGSATDVGRVRSQNQDAYLEADPIFAVADGMGGAAGGDVAARVAIQALRAAAEPSEEGLIEGVRRANQAVMARADDDPSLRGMGTTLSAIALVPGDDGDADGDRVVVANVGDSRVYLLRDDDLLQITRDHSLVGDLVEEGRLTREQARHHPQKNIVTRVVGHEAGLEVDTWEVIPFTGDRFLLCSDGLFDELEDERIAAVLRSVDDPERAAGELVDLANDAGGHDNTTVVIVDVVDDGGRSAHASAALPADGDQVTGAARAGTAATAGAVRAGAAAPEGPAESDRPSGPGDGDRRSSDAGARPVRSRITWRVVAFLTAVALVLGGAAATVVWYARAGWFVGVDGGDVAIFQGRPGGVLWFDPSLERRTGLGIDDLPPARRAAVREGKEQPSLAAAERYVDNLRDQAEQERRATTTTTTTTTAPPPPPPPGSP